MFSLRPTVLTVALGLAASTVAQLPKANVLFSDGLSPHVDAT
jgi:hypothetical protein